MVLFMLLYKAVLPLSLKTTKQFFSVAVFIMLCKVVLIFELK